MGARGSARFRCTNNPRAADAKPYAALRRATAGRALDGETCEMLGQMIFQIEAVED